ncbi:putative membrane protein [Erwinia amylovora ATCC 49946]|nr:putative membrane protein [Erwinia amylovora ATCC 49946]
MMATLQLLLAFASYFFISCAMVLVFLFIYMRITPHNEWRLIKENNLAATYGFIGALLGYIVPLASVAANSVNLLDYLLWGAVALVIQLLVFTVVRLFIRDISLRIEQNQRAAGLFLAAVSLGVGILNAACMTY